MTADIMTDTWLDVRIGDCRTVLDTLPEQSVHCVVTSPPYWGLRDYGTATWDGGDAECSHVKTTLVGTASTLRNDGRAHKGPYDGEKAFTESVTPYRDRCAKCGAVRVDAQLGLEATPEEYVANLVAVFRKVRRVLRDDGTLWCNLGDSYVQGGSGGSGRAGHNAVVGTTKRNVQGRGQRVDGLAQKQLVGIPWRVAFALQADGWYLRSDIIWAKPNPMPESVTDRPTKAHEYLFLLSKSPRYYFDQEAVRECFADDRMGNPGGGTRAYAIGDRNDATDSRMLTWRKGEVLGGRNIRTVWTIPTKPYPGAHFAVFPPELVTPCVKAGTSERGVCAECGAPWERVVEQRDTNDRNLRIDTVAARDFAGGAGHAPMSSSDRVRKLDGKNYVPVHGATTGWRPTCTHDAEPVPATVLDPFAGSGTVGQVANKLSRRAILIDLNPDYLEQIEKRNAQAPLGLV